ncbi:MAG TPA: 30S ribosomal protein S11, partial [Ruminococcaceae bacterium]|nr:30S ribosomal protein S11 [Oscillospiraceae bacterium]
MATAKGKTTATRRRREKKNIERGSAHIQSTFN